MRLAKLLTICGITSATAVTTLGKLEVIADIRLSVAEIASGSRSVISVGISASIVGSVLSTSPLTSVPTFPIIVTMCGKILFT